MTMMQKIQAKKSKKGFTLVELVIVIAILAILAAIAIPVITTTINSSKISVMESDTATLNMLVKECINTSKAKITTTTYGTAKNTADKATILDILQSNNLATDATKAGEFLKRAIGGVTYEIYYADHNVAVYGGGKTAPASGATKLAATTTIASLEPEGGSGNGN